MMTTMLRATGAVELEAAERLERDGRLAEAAGAYQRILEGAPDEPEALYRLGRVMRRLGHLDLELTLIGQAIARAPAEARYHLALADGLARAGLPADAEECFREALRLSPTPGPPRLNHGCRALREGRLLEAVDLLVAHLRDAPNDPTGFFYLGVALQEQELFEPAAASYRAALSNDPRFFEAQANLSTVLLALARPDEALEPACRAVELAPERPGAYLNRGNTRRDLGDLEGALADYRAAVDRQPDFAEAWSGLANLYHDLGEWSQALDAHGRAVRLAPTLAQAHWNRSFTLLTTGQLEAGWEEYEHRHQTKAACPEPRDFPWPLWRGEPLAGRRILVWREQGLGDELLFATCLPDLVARGARVTLLASDRLVGLLSRSFPEVDVRPDGSPPSSAAWFDFHSPIGSLPRWLRRRRAEFPDRGAWLIPDRGRRALWERRLEETGEGPRVGLCWQSGLVTPERRRHYAPLPAWGPLLSLPGISWVNLQYDDCEAELLAAEARWGITIRRWAGVDLRNDLEGVAALIACLDAVVTAPTAVGSFAGALAVPTWQVDAGGDWTALGEERSPWFPAIRVLRRPAGVESWDQVLHQAAQGLLDRLRERGGGGGGGEAGAQGLAAPAES